MRDLIKNKIILKTTIMIALSVTMLIGCSKQVEHEYADAPTDKDDTDTFDSNLLHLIQTSISRGANAGSNDDFGAYVDYPSFSLTETDAQKYPALKDALDNLSKSYETEYSTHLDEYYDLIKYSLEEDMEIQSRFFDSLSSEIRRADNHILSIFESYSSYTGGIHGYYAFYGDNINPKTGEELSLDNVITDADSFREIVKEKLYALYPEVSFDNLDEALKDVCTGNDMDTPWTMDYSGITLYFNPYHLSSYASGMQIVTIPFNEKPELFFPEYLDIPNAFAQQLNNNAPAILDVDGDGTNEAIYVIEENTSRETDDAFYNNYAIWNIYCGDKSITVSDCCYYGDFYLVRANDQYYIYIFEVSDNDYSICNVVDLNKMLNDSSKSFNGRPAGFGAGYEYTEHGFKSVHSEILFTDPSSFELSSRIESLGTGNGTKCYHVGSDGWPVSNEAYFNVSSSVVLTAKKDISCIEVDIEGIEKTDAVLTKGTHYVLVRTDNNSWADIQEVNEDEFNEQPDSPFAFMEKATGLNADRAIFRIPYNGIEWPHTIDGIGEDEIFDGIMYAG